MGRTRRMVDEEGSALIIALFFVSVFSLFVASVISFAEVGLRAAKNFDAQGQYAYATGGAVNAAINRFRGGGPCDDYTAPVGPDGAPLAGRGVIVRCVDDNRPASGRATKPVNALLSLGSDPAEGISTSGEQRVLGNIFSNSTVAAGATLIVQGQVSATGDCTGPIQTSPPAPLKCGPGGGADPVEGGDPDYTKAAATVPVRATLPTCDEAKWLVTLDPGYYDDAGTLSALTNGTVPACAGKVVWLQPGNYYLDFTFRNGAGTWTIDDPNVVVVAGVPRGWDPAALTRPAKLTGPGVVPGTCKTAADGLVPGVQLVAGGGTHLKIMRGQVELCAKPSDSDQSIALYGMAPDRPKHTLEPTSWTGVSGFTNPGNAAVIGELPVAPATTPAAAIANLSASSSSAALTLNAFRPRVPDGSLIDSATLRVVHREVGDMDDATPSVKVAADFAGSMCTGPLARTVPVSLGAFTEDRIDLESTCGLTDPAAFEGLAVTYSAALKAGGTTATDTLDGIAVEVVYRTPTTRKPTVVTASPPTGFVNPAGPPSPPTNALEIGEQPTPLTADAALSSTGATAASITVAGLGEPPIAPGSTIDSAVLRVAHRDQGDIAPPRVSVPFTGGTCTGMLLDVRPVSIVDDRVDLKACGLDDASKLIGLTATYDVALASGGNAATANLDGIWLEVVYRPPTRSPVTAAASPTPTAFTNPDNAKVIDGVATADATLISTVLPSASLTLADYGQPTLPAGSVIDSAVLRIAHQDVGPMDTPTLIVNGIGACSPVLTKHAATLGEDRVDLTACGLTAPSQLAGLSVTYTANLTAGTVTPPNATARVDGIVLDLAYRPPAVRQPTTAATTTPGFDSPDSARIIDAATADVTLANGAAPASVTVSGYDSSVPLPPGSVIDSAVLRVAHQDDAWMGPPTLAATFSGSTCPVQPPLPLRSGIGVDRSTDFAGCGLTKAEQLAGLSAIYTANAPTTTAAIQVPAATSGVTGFANEDRARAIDGMTADAALVSPGAASASITLGGYNQAPPPPGSTIDSAVLRIVHQDDAGVGPVTVSVSFTGGTCSAPQTLGPQATLGEDTVDLKSACGLTDPSQINDLRVTYAASLDGTASTASDRLDGAVVDLTYRAQSGTDHLDGIELDIVFRPPTFRALDGCLLGAYPAYPALQPDPAVACALVNVTPAAAATGVPPTRFAAQGTIYSPSAALDISMDGLKAQVITRGLVARIIRLALKADPGWKRPVMGVPPEPVKFTAYPDVTARPTTTASPPSDFANPDNAKAIGEQPPALATATFNSTSPTTASVTLGGFAQDAPLAGASIEAAVLRVVHREDIGIGKASVTIGGFPAGTPCAPKKTFPLAVYASPTTAPGALGEDQIDLTACGLTDPVLLGLTVTYTATVPAAPEADTVAYLDGITLDLLAGPLLRARVAFDASQDTVQVQGWSVLR